MTRRPPRSTRTYPLFPYTTRFRSRQAAAVAAASEQATANVQTVASAAEELSSSIAEIARQVAQSSQIAGQAVTEAERTNVQVQGLRSEEHTSELQSLMRISYAVFCSKKKKKKRRRV